ncbi:MAG: hypothetical protein JXX14_01400 [Deltaproteobacteria bacterium]|nr:hypothetical protein [Deltaproteobacteria bacterium]
MIISQSTVNLQSSHSKTTVSQEAESFRAWIDGDAEATAAGERPRDGASFQRIVDRVKLSAESLELAHGQMHGKRMRHESMPDDASLMKKLKACAQGRCEKGGDSDGEEDAMVADPRLNLMKQMVEMLSGKKVRLFDASQIDEANAARSSEAFAQEHQGRAAEGRDSIAPNADPEREGWGVSYDYSNTTVEREETTFAASGVVKTEDGREINFASSLHMERERVEVTSFQLRAGDAKLVDPLVLNFSGGAAELTEEKFNFDINSDGIDESISFVADGSGFLVYDRNGDGMVNNGTELFGPSTGNGFAELAEHDEDGNGWIDEADAVYSDLRVWRGNPSTSGLMDLRSGNVGAMYLGAATTPFEQRGADGTLLGQTAATGVFLSESGSVGTVQQVDLVG